MSILWVRDLDTTSATQAGPVATVRGVSFEIDKARSSAWLASLAAAIPRS